MLRPVIAATVLGAAGVAVDPDELVPPAAALPANWPISRGNRHFSVVDDGRCRAIVRASLPSVRARRP